MEFATRFLVDWARFYLLLIALYYLIGLIVCHANRAWVPDRKIQRNTPNPAHVRRDIIQSTISLLQIAAFLAIGMAHRAARLGVQPWEPSAATIVAGICLSLVVFDTWFYWGHRLLHTRILYSRAHRWHHSVTNPTVWSNNSDTFLDNLVLQSYWMIAPLFVPAPSIVFLIHKIFDQISGMIGHSGYEYNASTARFPSPLLAVTHHDQHHRHFKYNFATHFVVWDRFMNTLHPQYDQMIDSHRSSHSLLKAGDPIADKPTILN